MKEMCRLCLSVSLKIAHDLEKEPKVVEDLSLLNIQIATNKLLPTLVCVTCMKTLQNMLKYRKTILLNQCKLVDLLKNTKNLDSCSQSLNENSLVDTIKKETISDLDDNNSDDTFKYELQLSSYERNSHHNDSFFEKTHFKTVLNGNNDVINKNQPYKKRKLKRKLDTLNKNIISHKAVQDYVDSKEDLVKATVDLKFDHNETKQNKVEINNAYQNDLTLNHNKCLTCLTYLPSRKQLIEHYKTSHTGIKKNKWNTDNIIKEEENQENNKEISKSDADESKRLYVCKICGRTFPSVYRIVRHGLAHSVTSLCCSHGCGYSTVYQAALKDHEKRHVKDYKHKCSTCGAGFHVKTWHDQHQNIHKNIKPFVCDLCGLAFHMDRYLKTHRLAVHSDVTKGAKQFICPHCDIPLNNIKEYKKHLEIHEGKKRFLCDICGKECSSSEVLRYHKNKHFDVKPHTCRICNKSFMKKYNLTLHSRAHAGLKHLCNTCGNHFAQRSTLLRHIRKFHPEIKQSPVSKHVDLQDK